MVLFVLLFKTRILQFCRRGWRLQIELESVWTVKKILQVISKEWNVFAANYVKADFKVATFLAFIVADAYRVLGKLLAPERSKYKSFVQYYEKRTERFGNPALISKSLINKFLEISADQDENNLTARATYIVRTFMEQALDQQLICSRLLQSYLQKL